jgi:chromosome segregation ATPase
MRGKVGMMAHIALSINGQQVFTENTDDFSQAVNVIQGYMLAQTQQMQSNFQAEVENLRSQIMALTAAEQQRFTEVSGMLTEVGGEIQTFVTLLNDTIANLTQQVADLQAAAESAAAEDLAEDAAYQEAAANLQASLDALQAQAAEHETAVVGAFDQLGTSITAIDEQFGGDATPTTPAPEETTTTPAPVEEPPFEDVPVEGVVDDSGAVG